MRKTALLVTVSGALLAALVALSGVAWALTTIECPHDPQHWGYERGCFGTDRDELLIGTPKADYIEDGRGDDVVRGGRGADEINTDCDLCHDGRDTTFGGPGRDRTAGNLDPDELHGGLGNDSVWDAGSKTEADVLYCGPGYDKVFYNPGVDKVARNCEELHPVEW